MAKKPDSLRTDAGYCLYGAEYLLNLVGTLSGEIEGVRLAKDIEYVHRMRVATRRIRAALPLYRDCFSRKEYHRWRTEIRTITRALGEARDADVQIEYLQQYLDDLCTDGHDHKSPLFFLPSVAEQTNTEWISAPAGFAPGIECLILRLRQKRKALQPDVIAAFDHLIAEEVIREMEDALQRVVVTGTRRHTDIHSPYAYEQAFNHISQRLEEVFAYDRYVAMPDNIEMHHAMRIAAKRLRYTMECFADLYLDHLKTPVRAVKNLQDILGDMHDCDVWADMLPTFMAEEKTRTEEYFGHDRFFAVIEPGLQHLRNERIRERRTLYDALVTTWEELRADGTWEELRVTISTPLQGHRSGCPGLPISAPVYACLRRYDPDPAHAKQVCRLSLLLYDELTALHGMGARERTLLRDAALLHDTGWAFGRKMHHKRSMEIIRTDPSLPFSDRDRQIIAQVARYHRRAEPSQEHAAFAALNPVAQQTVTGLAAILRIADALDVTHQSAVTTLRCDTESDAVVISYAAERPAPAEEAQAVKKSTLFTRVYQHRIVIRWVHQP